MTQAFNLSQLANNLNTSGQLDATDGLSGLVPLANGGTGATNTVNSIVAGTGISTSVSGTQVTINSTVTGGVTSLNGQTGAITNTSFNSIGSYAIGAIKTANTTVTEGSTYAGSSIFQATQGTYYGIANAVFTTASNTNLGWAGTWRAMNRSKSNTADPCTGEIACGSNLWVRIS